MRRFLGSVLHRMGRSTPVLILLLCAWSSPSFGASYGVATVAKTGNGITRAVATYNQIANDGGVGSSFLTDTGAFSPQMLAPPPPVRQTRRDS